jgi:hypothetical protein
MRWRTTRRAASRHCQASRCGAECARIATAAALHVLAFRFSRWRGRPMEAGWPLPPMTRQTRWDLRNWKTIRVLKGHMARIRCLDWSRDSRRIVSGGNDKTIRLWDVESGKTLQTFAGHTDSPATPRHTASLGPPISTATTATITWCAVPPSSYNPITWDQAGAKPPRRSTESLRTTTTGCYVTLSNRPL